MPFSIPPFPPLRRFLVYGWMLVVLCGLILGCDRYDREFFPYMMKGLNVMVYDAGLRRRGIRWVY